MCTTASFSASCSLLPAIDTIWLSSSHRCLWHTLGISFLENRHSCEALLHEHLRSPPLQKPQSLASWSSLQILVEPAIQGVSHAQISICSLLNSGHLCETAVTYNACCWSGRHVCFGLDQRAILSWCRSLLSGLGVYKRSPDLLVFAFQERCYSCIFGWPLQTLQSWVCLAP